MRLVKYALIGMVVGLISGQTSLHARGVPDWPYDKLWEASDVVVVIEPLKTENNDDKLNLKWDPNTKFQGLTTHFKVHGVFKGGPVSDEIILKHFDYLPDPDPNKTTVISDGCFFIHFRAGTFQSRETIFQDGKKVSESPQLNQAPLFLAFLKKAVDGTYIAVTGQEDPAFSFRDLRIVQPSWIN